MAGKKLEVTPEREYILVKQGSVPPLYSHVDFSYFKEVPGVKGHHLDVMMNINHLLLRENLFFYISLKVTCGSTVTGSDSPDLPRHRNAPFRE